MTRDLGLPSALTHGMEISSRFLWALVAMNLALWSCVFPKTLESGTLGELRILELGVLPIASPGQQYIRFPSHCCLGRVTPSDYAPWPELTNGVCVSTDSTPDRGFFWATLGRSASYTFSES